MSSSRGLATVSRENNKRACEGEALLRQLHTAQQALGQAEATAKRGLFGSDFARNGRKMTERSVSQGSSSKS